METIHVNRRQLLQLMLGVAAGLAIQPARQVIDWRNRSELLDSHWAALFREQESAVTVGQAYLQAYAHEADPHRLGTQIALDVAGHPEGLRYAEDTALKARLQQRIQQDFADDNVVKLSGWILSITEARLYALAALAGEPRAGV